MRVCVERDTKLRNHYDDDDEFRGRDGFRVHNNAFKCMCRHMNECTVLGSQWCIS